METKKSVVDLKIADMCCNYAIFTIIIRIIRLLLVDTVSGAV